MDILLLARELKEAADLVVTDREGRSLLIIEVNPRPGSSQPGIDQVREHQHRFGFPFAMFADPSQIWLFGSVDLTEPLGRFSTPETLLPYDPRFERNRISRDYMQGLIEGWLADCKSSWRYPSPPHHEALKAAGLAQRLVGGEIDIERAD